MSEYIFIGGSHGIAEASIRLLLQRDPQARVHLYSREVGPWASENRVLWHCFDAANSEELNVSEVNFAQFRGLVYAPGSLQLKPFTSLKLEDFRKDFEVNYFGCVRVLQTVIPQSKASTLSPSFVMFSSVAAFRGLPMHASIASAKAALEGLSRSLAAEYAPRMRFNCVAPSLTDTPLAQPITSREASRKISEERHPLKRLGTSNDVAHAVDFLLSDASSWMSGQVLRPDGAMSL
jgi:NAD(P)-dependent dehydrogenase (short-subunit alcohol dehydrogenase family)